jgi:uncharacterized SAM-binding protein YcdF (DUF218 family)
MTEEDRSFKTAAVVLGGGLQVVEKSGERIYELEEQVKVRLDKAHKLFFKGEVDYIVTTGKYSKRVGIDPNISGPQTEAAVGKKYLMDMFGLDEEFILCEEMSHDTIGNAWFAKILCLEPYDILACKIITSEFHKGRSILIFEWVLDPQYTKEYIIVPSTLTDEEREERDKLEKAFIAFMKDHLFGSIPPGDDKKIREFMENEHLRYCLSERSEAMLATFMKTAAIKAGYKEKKKKRVDSKGSHFRSLM